MGAMTLSSGAMEGSSGGPSCSVGGSCSGSLQLRKMCLARPQMHKSGMKIRKMMTKILKGPEKNPKGSRWYSGQHVSPQHFNPLGQVLGGVGAGAERGLLVPRWGGGRIPASQNLSMHSGHKPHP